LPAELEPFANTLTIFIIIIINILRTQSSQY
jgi:hypothetical protein